MNNLRRSLAGILVCALSACSLAPDFSVPSIPLPEQFKEPAPTAAETPPGEWGALQSLEAQDRGAWWKWFGDDMLSALETRAMLTNPSLAAAAERLKAARARAESEAGSLLPSITLEGNAVRRKPSSAGAAGVSGITRQLDPYSLYSLEGVAAYELDLFGRVRDNEAALRLNAAEEEALYHSMLLALQADVAQHYFQLRATDEERALLKDAITIRKEAVRIMQRRVQVGYAGTLDLARTETELATTEADLLALDRARATLEHMLAVLVGEIPSRFSVPPATTFTAAPPAIPAGVPSTLLARRPDIAAATNAMAAANRRIGVARTALFPIVSLTASGGAESGALSSLFEWSNRTWALGQLGGALVAWNLFDSGRSLAKIDVAQANYEASVAEYRAQVLVAFRDVEDALSDQHLLAEQAEEHEKARLAAAEAANLVHLRYTSGDVDYADVVDADRTALAAARSMARTRGARFSAAVALIRALGGGWSAPTAD